MPYPKKYTPGYFVQNEVCDLELKIKKVPSDFCPPYMDIIKRIFKVSEFNLASNGQAFRVHW